MKRFLLAVLIGISFLSPSAQASEVRGVWIPDPSHTKLMHTYANLVEGVRSMSELGINTLFLCTYAKTEVAFRSRVYTHYSTFTSPDDSYMFARYSSGYDRPLKSPTGDPVRDLLDQARVYGMKVIFWFEYGFMGSHGPTPANHPLLAKNPAWQSAGNDGKQAAYNGSDYYLNAYHPAFQEFLIELFEESLRLYPDVDGVQGDDRTPAMPRNSGYDAYTVVRYQSEHSGALPSFDFKDEAWTAWRLDILNKFARNLYGRIKAKGTKYLVCMAPNPYPWCRDNLMQDSQTWLRDGVVDLLSVQCYRFEEKAYRYTVDETMRYVREATDRNVLNPGIILKAGSRFMAGQELEKQIRINRELKTNGESYFYNEGFVDPAIREVLKKMYAPTKKAASKR